MGIPVVGGHIIGPAPAPVMLQCIEPGCGERAPAAWVDLKWVPSPMTALVVGLPDGWTADPPDALGLPLRCPKHPRRKGA